MNIKKFKRKEFGSLTTLQNPKTGNVMFIGREIAKMWGHTNLTQSIKAAKLDNNEFMVIRLSDFPEFKKHLSNCQLVTSKTPRITLVSESGLYKLALASHLPKAKPFKDWVTKEVLPAIRKYGHYRIADEQERVDLHLDEGYQKYNSSEINKLNYDTGGTYGAINYNRKNCKLHTGMSPKEVKQYGRNKGLKASEATSAKEVLRRTKPAVACAMSFTDNMVKRGFDLETVSKLSLQSAIPLFEGMIEMGALPAELNQK